MNALTRWNPVRELEEFQNRILSAFRPMNGRYQNGEGGDSLTVTEWSPAVSISEDGREYRITAEIPGVRPEDVKVTLENGTLSIAGERRSEREEGNVRHHLTERVHGRFQRAFTLPADSDPSQVDAQFTNGLLSVRIAKSEKARPKQIEIRVAA